MAGTILAHVDGGVPNLRVELPRLPRKHSDRRSFFSKPHVR
jgi:hypothetical protein